MMPPPHDQLSPQLLPAYQSAMDQITAPPKRRMNQDQCALYIACYPPNKDKERFVILLIFLAILVYISYYERL